MVASGGNIVLIADIPFPIRNFVRLQDIAVPPNPVIFGDTELASDSAAMTQLIQTSWVGGRGIYIGNARTDTERFWYSHLKTLYRHVLALPTMTYRVLRPTGAAAAAPVTLIIEYNSEIYAAFGAEVSRFIDSAAEYEDVEVSGVMMRTMTDATTAWSATEHGALANITDGIVFQGLLFVAWSTGYSYRDSGGTWSAVTATPTTYFAEMNNLLYRIGVVSSAYKMFFSADGVNWTAGGSLPKNITVHDLVVFRNAAGALTLYALTNVGPWLYNIDNDVFERTELLLPPLDSNDQSVGEVWRDARLYMTTGGLGMVAVQAGNPLTINPMGLDRDDGVPADQQGTIRGLASDLNVLIALVDHTVPDDDAAHEFNSGLYQEFAGAHGWLNVGTGHSSLQAWNGAGWGELWHDKLDGAGATRPVIVSSAYNKRRVYWNANGYLYFQELPTTIYNPLQAPRTLVEFGPQHHVTPWWDYSTGIQRKVHGHMFLTTKNCSALNYVKVYYQKDFDESSWLLFGTITTDGIIDLSPGATGIQARYIRFMVELDRDPDVHTISPTVEHMASEVMRVLPPTFAFGFEVDLTKQQPFKQRTMLQLVAELKKLCDPSEYPGFYSMSYRDALQGDQTYYGRISRVNGQEATPDSIEGQGIYYISFIAPYPGD